MSVMDHDGPSEAAEIARAEAVAKEEKGGSGWSEMDLRSEIPKKSSHAAVSATSSQHMLASGWVPVSF